MKITKKHNDGLTNFNILKSGDIFLHCDRLYMKTEFHILSKGGSINAVNIETGTLSLFSKEAEVKKVEAELIVEV